MKFSPVLLIMVAFTLCIGGCDTGETQERQGRTITPPPMSPELEALLKDGGTYYDTEAQLLTTRFRSPGYHTGIVSGTLVHPTRESLIYALALLQRNAEGDAERAADIIGRVIDLQDSDPDSRTYGVWPWLLEEPLSKMKSPDLNWADFCGSQLVHILIEHPARLPSALRARMRSSLRQAVSAIRRRDVSPGYTNIAILGGVVCVAAGELFNDSDLLAYGRVRLQRVVEHVERNGGFSEYNSPPYSKVIIGECERLLHLASDPASREAAESIRRFSWEEISASFHPASQQWAGPHSRNSRLYLQPTTVEFLSKRTGVKIKTHPAMLGDVRPGRYATVLPIVCPPESLPRFQKFDQARREARRIFTRTKLGVPEIIGTTWHSGDACLGSVNRSSLWTQRKPLIAYWTTDEDPAVVFRLRYLHDGKDFASMGVRTSQAGSRVLCLFESLPNRGDWHRTLDRPTDGIFRAKDFRIRFELVGVGTKAAALGDNRYELSAGTYRVVVHTLPAQFAGRDVQWRLSETGQSVEGICYHGESRQFDFESGVDMRLCAGIELIRTDEAMTHRRPVMSGQVAETVAVEWTVSDETTLAVTKSGQ